MSDTWRSPKNGWQYSLMAALLALLTACSSPKPLEPPSATATATGEQVAVMALSMLGKPYRWGGSNPRQGFDCSGLAMHVFREAAGIRLPRTARMMAKHGAFVRKERLQPGDLVFFNTGSRNSHVGIYIGHQQFVHAPASGRRIQVARLDSRYWRRAFSTARRPSL